MATFVLVHGGIMGGWAWKRVVPFLRAAGHEVYTPTLTGMGERVHLASPAIGLDTHIQDIVNVLEYEDLEKVVLVGHSYAGQVITGVAARVPHRLAHLVYFDAVIPKPGLSCLDHWQDDRAAMDQEVQTNGDGWRMPPMPPQQFGIFNEADVQWVSAKVTPHPYKTFQDPLFFDPSVIEAIPRTAIECLWDQPPPSEPPAWAVEMRYQTLRAAHTANVTAPRELADLLLEVVEVVPSDGAR